MYFKLAFRNAKRSAFDYLLYIFTMVMLVSIMFVSNAIAMFGKMQAGFQTAALPMIIVLVMLVLMDYIKAFMIKQRAKEFATYILLGMEKKKLSQLFNLEVCVIGIGCFLAGVLLGIGVYYIWISTVLKVDGIQLLLLFKSALQTFFFFCAVECISAIRIKQKINGLQISELLKEKEHNQHISAKNKTLWGIVFGSSILSFIALLMAIVFFSNSIVDFAISFISLPALLSVVSFYKWLFATLASKRLKKSEFLYQGLIVYKIAEMTSGIKTSTVINSVFCICLLFSASSFVCGVVFLNSNLVIFETKAQQWMGFLQVSQCIIFIIIYFSIISLLQIVGLKRQAKNIRILHYLGKSQVELKFLIRVQILVKLFMPTLMCFALLIIGVPFANYKMNEILPMTMHNEILRAVGLFSACFATLYLCYFLLVNSISKRYINASINL